MPSQLAAAFPVTVAFATHRDFEAMLPQDLLIVVRTVLAIAIRVVISMVAWRHIRPETAH
ncbi:hypothetical protein AN191_02125 [Loktanella sp. 5RATIMAR09]|nr:hypothetical protein AN191_02125 [Loktanella sp. 5RATIMAR09]